MVHRALDWSQATMRDDVPDGGQDGLPGIFAELGRRRAGVGSATVAVDLWGGLRSADSSEVGVRPARRSACACEETPTRAPVAARASIPTFLGPGVDTDDLSLGMQLRLCGAADVSLGRLLAWGYVPTDYYGDEPIEYSDDYLWVVYGQCGAAFTFAILDARGGNPGTRRICGLPVVTLIEGTSALSRSNSRYIYLTFMMSFSRLTPGGFLEIPGERELEHLGEATYRFTLRGLESWSSTSTEGEAELYRYYLVFDADGEVTTASAHVPSTETVRSCEEFAEAFFGYFVDYFTDAPSAVVELEGQDYTGGDLCSIEHGLYLLAYSGFFRWDESNPCWAYVMEVCPD